MFIFLLPREHTRTIMWTISKICLLFIWNTTCKDCYKYTRDPFTDPGPVLWKHLCSFILKECFELLYCSSMTENMPVLWSLCTNVHLQDTHAASDLRSLKRTSKLRKHYLRYCGFTRYWANSDWHVGDSFNSRSAHFCPISVAINDEGDMKWAYR
jgi:hypothetical protein